MNPEAIKAFIKKAFKDVIENIDADESVIEKYFSKDYKQWVDGHELDYQGFVSHMKAQKQRIARVNIEFERLVVEGEDVATIHHIDALTKDNHPVKGIVIAHLSVRDNKICFCKELTKITHGREEDKELGHVTE